MMLNFLKSWGLNLLILGLIIVLYFLYMARLKRKYKREGIIEKTIENLTKHNDSVKKALDAEMEYGSVIEELENDDTKQFENKVNYKYVEPKKINNDFECGIECLQFRKSPWQHH